jgi:hypothetical protein
LTIARLLNPLSPPDVLLKPAPTRADATVLSGGVVTNFTSPPSVFDPYSVPCGPRSTSMRCRSSGSMSGVSTPPAAYTVLDPYGASSTYVPTVALPCPLPEVMPRSTSWVQPWPFEMTLSPGTRVA